MGNVNETAGVGSAAAPRPDEPLVVPLDMLKAWLTQAGIPHESCEPSEVEEWEVPEHPHGLKVFNQKAGDAGRREAYSVWLFDDSGYLREIRHYPFAVRVVR